MQTNVLSDEERISRIWDIEEIRALMSRRSYYFTRGLRDLELDELWVAEPENRAEASFGSNWGFYKGLDSIRRWYSGAFPAGSFCSRCVNTPYIILSDDGQSARARWYMSGQDTIPQGTSFNAWWYVWTLGADFIREKGRWKLLHLVEAQDFYCPVGENFDDQPVWPVLGDNPEQVRFGTADFSFQTHDNTYMLEDDWPPVPKNYERLNMYNSYGPEGHPGLNDKVENLAWATEVASRKAWGR